MAPIDNPDDRVAPEALSDSELHRMLLEWKAPRMPKRLYGTVFPSPRMPWWRRSIAIPLPVLSLLALGLLVCVTMGSRYLFNPRVFVKTERMTVPAVPALAGKQVVSATQGLPAVTRRHHTRRPPMWIPVRELRPRIVRSSDDTD